MIGLAPPTAAKVRQLIDRSKGAGASLQSTGKGYGRVPVLVRCTSAAAADTSGVGAQCYPGVIVDPLADRTVQPELGAVWLTLLDAGGAAAVPAAGRVYECLLAGSVAVGTDSRPRAFGAAPPPPPAVGYGFAQVGSTIVPNNGAPYSLATAALPAAGTYLVVYRVSMTWYRTDYTGLYDVWAMAWLEAAGAFVSNSSVESRVGDGNTAPQLQAGGILKFSVSNQTVIAVMGATVLNVMARHTSPAEFQLLIGEVRPTFTPPPSTPANGVDLTWVNLSGG